HRLRRGGREVHRRVLPEHPVGRGPAKARARTEGGGRSSRLRRIAMRYALIIVIALSLPVAVAAQEREGHEKSEAGEASKSAELAPALKGVKVSLASGLRAAEKEGRPISGKFELEDGKLQLSVYTTKDDKFAEVIVDHQTGKVAKSEPITGGEDLA